MLCFFHLILSENTLKLHYYATLSVSYGESKLQYETPSLSLPLALYPNLEELGDYMGLSLNSDEVQRNLALVPVADNVSDCH